ncbi:MAG: hypothetical protein KAJ07_08075 [Planctomycetes bacterium]|nr:hypothetical protein [Planctomycetota bacterium]
MPAGKPSQSNAMMYTMIMFVALFFIAGTCAVLFYTSSENYKAQANDLTGKISSLASEKEQRELSKSVGKRKGKETYFSMMSGYIDELTSAVTGEMTDETTLSARVNDAKEQINKMMEQLGQDAGTSFGPEGAALLATISSLKSELDTARAKQQKSESMLADLQDDYDVSLESFRLEEDRLIEEKNHYQKQTDEVQADYDDLAEEHRKSADDQIKSYMAKLEAAQATLKQKGQQIQQLQADLSDTGGSLKDAIAKLEAIKPRPDIEVAAYRPDAGVVSVDMQTDTVFLDIGSNDHVYIGLTFSIYDKNTPVPEDGIGKAQVEVFGVTETVSAARIVQSSKKNPIVPDDMAVNLIWDKMSSNSFVVAGQFDFDGNGKIDHDGREKIIDLIKRWGGKVTTDLNIDTDFVILGYKPEMLSRPTMTDLERDPMLEDKYAKYQKKDRYYNNILSRAGTFSVPVFNQDRFLFLIGYETLASKSSPF